MVVLCTHLNFTQVGRVRTRFDLSTSKAYAAAIQRAAERLTIWSWSLVDFRVWGYVSVAKQMLQTSKVHVMFKYPMNNEYAWIFGIRNCRDKLPRCSLSAWCTTQFFEFTFFSLFRIFIIVVSRWHDMFGKLNHQFWKEFHCSSTWNWESILFGRWNPDMCP